MEQVPVHSWVELNGTSSKKIGTEYNTGWWYLGITHGVEPSEFVERNKTFGKG